MKKHILLCAALTGAVVLSSCGAFKSSESAYRQAYEKAKAQENKQAADEPIYTESPVVTPVDRGQQTQQSSSSQQQEHVTTIRTYDAARDYSKPNKYNTSSNASNATYRKENVKVVNGTGLKNFSVVVGSFSLQANAEGLMSTLKSAGYDAQVVFNEGRNLYRVVASTFNDKESAVESRNKLRSENYPDAWLLYSEGSTEGAAQ